MSLSDANPLDLIKRLSRERKARREAEMIAERVTSELYSALNEREKINRELGLLNQSLRDFVAVASHDLRGPLTSVIGFLATVRKNWGRMPETEKLEFLEIAEKQSIHIARLVEDLLTVSRIESGWLDTHKKAVELRKAVTEAMHSFGKRSAEIAVSIPGEVAVLADPDHILRILSNFRENALKYGSPPIELRVSSQDDAVEIRVSDRGKGIPDDFLPRLFQKFARADAAGKHGQGTGLGLSIVKGLAEVNGGTVWYEPNLPTGACFVVRLPRAA